MQDNLIKITINKVTHEFKAGDVESMRALPWPERKQLIDLLEEIKQAEYVERQEQQTRKIATPNVIGKKAVDSQNTGPVEEHVKAGQGDVDSIMNRLILEEKQHQSSIPDKSTVVKWMLVVFVGIVLITLLF